jgi:Carbohydrate esterase, sialic acid-specific acetylesterase
MFKTISQFALAGLVSLSLNDTSQAAGFNDTTGRSRVACHSATAKEIVILTFGQSISANHGEAAYTPHGEVINFNPNDKQCYAATDPLLGATANTDSHVGSIWGYLCDSLLETKRWDRCITAPVAQGGTNIKDWAPAGGDLVRLVRQAVEGLNANGLTPSAMLFGQGEADASVNADPAAYEADFNAMVANIRSFSDAPILVAVETICYLQNWGLTETDEDVRVRKWIGQEKIEQAQRALVNPARGIFAGPDLDFINGKIARWDGCHLSTYGLKAAAAQWKYYLLEVVTP